MLIAFRAIMGIGGAAVLPVTLAIITVVFPRHERGRAIGLWAAAVGGAVALGPVLGGLLLQYPKWTNWLTGNDWGSVFLINVPIVAVGLVGDLAGRPGDAQPAPAAPRPRGPGALDRRPRLAGVRHHPRVRDTSWASRPSSSRSWPASRS